MLFLDKICVMHRKDVKLCIYVIINWVEVPTILQVPEIIENTLLKYILNNLFLISEDQNLIIFDKSIRIEARK